MAKYRKSAMLILVALLAVAFAVLIEAQTGENGKGSTLEYRLQTVLSRIDGAGAVRVLVNETESGEVVGVCVLTEAADDVATVFRLQRAVRTVLGIENERIEVIQMEEDAE